jgi:hypothetical protein
LISNIVIGRSFSYDHTSERPFSVAMEESRDAWTWRDTLARLQHIDKIIETIVTRAIALNVGLLAAIAAIITSAPSGSESLLPYLALAAFIINIIFALQLARQQCLHHFYFKELGKKEKLGHLLPLKYRKKYEKEIERNTDKSNGLCCTIGIIPYCEMWICLLIIMCFLFIVLFLRDFLPAVVSFLFIVFIVLLILNLRDR